MNSTRDLHDLRWPPEYKAGSGLFVFDCRAGSHIDNTIKEGIKVASDWDVTVQFTFNEVVVSVRADSNPGLIYRDWSRALSGYIDKAIGPHPKPELSDEEKASDAKIEAANEERLQQWRREADERQRVKELTLRGALSQAPASLTLKDQEGWDTTVSVNKDGGYGEAVIVFADQWARLMEARIANGDTIEACADEACSLADDQGITGFQYGCAVSILSKVWVHGEGLRRWHNIKTQFGTEGEKANETGGVLNPAIISIGKE